jgi:CxxC motif-containing protein (DUF1111 family)
MNMNKKRFAFILVLAMVAVFSACEFTPAEDAVLDGPIEGLSPNESLLHLQGDAAFNQEVFSPSTGLGPLFVATSCGSCHAGDGKGHPFSTLTRFGQNDTNGNLFLTQGGPQLQDHAIPGYEPEHIPAGASSAKFLPPAVTGLGYLDAVADADILAMADPTDANADGVSGVVSWIELPNYVELRPGTILQGNKGIGRFGLKSGAYNLMHQTVNAYNQDMGINSVYAPYDTYSGLEVEPEVTTNTLQAVVFYLKTLKAPIPRNTGDPTVVAGKQTFINIGCANCHTPQLQTSNSPISVLANKTFYPYTDLLLHNMGPTLDDGYTEGTALTAEWRTPPLWGLGLAKNSQGGQYYLLHDGRAHSIQEAILLHDGEGANSKNLFQSLNSTDQQNLLKFLESL